MIFMDNYQKKLSKIAKYLAVFFAILFLQYVFFPPQQDDAIRSIPPEVLRATSQLEITTFIDHYRINDTRLEEALGSLGLSLSAFENAVEISFVLDVPKNNQFGVVLVFTSEIDHERLSLAYAAIAKDFLTQFHQQADIKPATDQQ